jgi:hypothetical protein
VREIYKATKRKTEWLIIYVARASATFYRLHPHRYAPFCISFPGAVAATIPSIEVSALSDQSAERFLDRDGQNYSRRFQYIILAMHEIVGHL